MSGWHGKWEFLDDKWNFVEWLRYPMIAFFSAENSEEFEPVMHSLVAHYFRETSAAAVYEHDEKMRR